MPIYEYQCEQCGNIEEALQKISEDPLTTCKNCSGTLHKLISHSTFHLKGSGWYVTDYAKKSASGTPTESPRPKTDDTKSSASDGSKTSTSETSA
jgi:putative FmdB family regulatory protein